MNVVFYWTEELTLEVSFQFSIQFFHSNLFNFEELGCKIIIHILLGSGYYNYAKCDCHEESMWIKRGATK